MSINSQKDNIINQNLIKEINQNTSNNNNVNSANSYAQKNNEELKEKTKLNQEYYDEFNRPKYDDIIQYENLIRQEIENNSPLVSDQFDIEHLLIEFRETIFENAILNVMKKYKYIRTIRRDGIDII